MTTSPAEPPESTLAASAHLCDAFVDDDKCCEAVADPACDFIARGLGYSQAWRACTPEHRIRLGVQLFLAGNWTLPPDLLPAITAATAAHVEVEAGHLAHVADVESRHPQFGAFLRRATEDPEVREAYYAAQSRRDGDDHERADAAEPGWDVQPSDAAGLAGLEGEVGEPAATSGLEADPELPRVVGRARSGLIARVAQLEADLAAAEAKLAAVEALADRWEQEAVDRGPDDYVLTDGVAALLRAALTTQPAP